jgi:hypothetical protein
LIWQFDLAIQFGNSVWQFSLAVQFGSSALQFGNSVWQNDLAFRQSKLPGPQIKFELPVRFGNLIWQFGISIRLARILAGIVSGRNCGQESNFGCSSFGGAP